MATEIVVALVMGALNDYYIQQLCSFSRFGHRSRGHLGLAVFNFVFVVNAVEDVHKDVDFEGTICKSYVFIGENRNDAMKNAQGGNSRS